MTWATPPDARDGIRIARRLACRRLAGTAVSILRARAIRRLEWGSVSEPGSWMAVDMGAGSRCLGGMTRAGKTAPKAVTRPTPQGRPEELLPRRQTDARGGAAARTLPTRLRGSLASPKIIKRASRWARTCAKARKRVGKSFCGTNRPQPRITGGLPGSNQESFTGTLDFSKRSSVSTGLYMVVMLARGSAAVSARSFATPSETATIPSAQGYTR